MHIVMIIVIIVIIMIIAMIIVIIITMIINSNLKQATFFLLDVFMRIKILFFNFCLLVCIFCFLYVWNFLVKKDKDALN